MSRKSLSYEDAVKLLGGSSRVVTALSRLAGATLTVMSAGGVDAALHLFELKNEVEHLAQESVTGLSRRLTGLGRFRRSELLQAAHAVLVVSAFFAALDDLDEELRTALNSASMELTKPEQVALGAGHRQSSGKAGLADLVRRLNAPGSIPGLDAGMNTQDRELGTYYADLGQRVHAFAAGTAAWDRVSETTRSKWSRAVTSDLPDLARTRYEAQLAKLAGEFPEFAFWASRVGVQSVLGQMRKVRRDTHDLGTSLQALTAVLARQEYGRAPHRVRSDLVSSYRAQIDKPVARAAGTLSDGVRLPPLRELYVNPSYRALPKYHWGSGNDNVSESVWIGAQAHLDLYAAVIEHLISVQATQAPLVVLGHPGAGKSVFTEMLAAQLDPRDFLVVRVELRAVPSDTGIQEQIEAALKNLTGRVITWPDLTDIAGDAQPVILLDGFDELLQASGVTHFDFLEQVEKFQEREAQFGRPVAALVTSRTAVANQVRYPDATPVVRLADFNEAQVRQWLDVWNRYNRKRPLKAETALSQSALASQPLLLFLLALFHSNGGNLTSGISTAHLYQNLFTSFVERDVDKLDSGLAPRDRERMVQRDLDHLSMVAFAMFNRGHQSVTEADVVADLTALQPSHQVPAELTGRAVALSIAERMAGRFFFRLFVHKDQAMRGQQLTLSTYEFLHTSFGEFLIARWTVDELARMGEHERRTADDLYSSPADDSKLHALLSAAVLSTREQRVLSFITELLTETGANELTGMRALLTRLFRGCLQPRAHDPYPQYRPVAHTVPGSYAVYSANLLLLLLLVADAQATVIRVAERAYIPLEQLRTTGPRPSAGVRANGYAEFQVVTRLWHAELSVSEWESLLQVVHLGPVSSKRASKALAVSLPGRARAPHRLAVSGRRFTSPPRSQIGRLGRNGGARPSASFVKRSFSDPADTRLPAWHAPLL